VIFTEADAPWLLFEYMKHGDLASVLRQNSPRLVAVGGTAPMLGKNVDVQQKHEQDGILKYSSDEEEAPFQLKHVTIYH